MKIKLFSEIKIGTKFLLVNSTCVVFEKVNGNGYNAVELCDKCSKNIEKREYIGPNALVII